MLHHKLIGKYPPCTQRLGLSELKIQEEVRDMESSLAQWLEQEEQDLIFGGRAKGWQLPLNSLCCLQEPIQSSNFFLEKTSETNLHF